ncbi:MAG: hypothetical protein JWQ35_314 [Bacteriovoracaceae bacterium]|nr:hypothetical protein [Bacteriovoracaceae bacterium]
MKIFKIGNKLKTGVPMKKLFCSLPLVLVFLGWASVVIVFFLEAEKLMRFAQ